MTQQSPPRNRRESEAPGTSWATAAGGWLFRYRAWTALPVVALAGFELATQSPRGAADHGPVAGALISGCRLLSPGLMAAGVTLRLATLSRIPPEVPTRGRRVAGPILVTWGPYAWTRNPLYLGNFAMVCGLLALVGSPWLAMLTLIFFAMQYSAIVSAEEAFLARTHGQAFEDWAARVPRWVPRRPVQATTPGTSPARPPGFRPRRPRDLWRAFLNDADTWFAALTGYLAVWWWTGHDTPGAALDAMLASASQPDNGASTSLLPGAIGALVGTYLAVRLIRRWQRKRGAKR